MKTKTIYFLMSMTILFSILVNVTKSYSQATSSYYTAPAPNEPYGADYLGWDATVTIPLVIKTENTYPINFYTSYATSPVLRMTILPNGKVAVNNSTVAAGSQFEVNNDINLTSSVFAHGYRIGDVLLLSKPGTRNVFLGESAGDNLTTGADNFFSGYKAGENNANGSWNTFVGSEAGENNVSGEYNTFVGDLAGMSNINGSHNSFFGHHSGEYNVASENTYIGYHTGGGVVGGTPTSAATENTFVGNSCGLHIETGADNSMLGVRAGQTISSGSYNSLFGVEAGRVITTGYGNVMVGYNTGWFVQTGYYNTFIGTQSGPNTYVNTHNACAIGYNASVLNSDNMILGDNNVNVGIGLSGNSTGPRSKLEINTGVSNTSGLQFTQLINGASSGQVLTTDNLGKVILVPDAAGLVSAQNGLSVTGGNTVELGGSLLYPTDIDLAGYDLTLDGSGNTIGTLDIGSTTHSAKLNVTGSAAVAYTNSGGTEIAAYFESVDQASIHLGNNIYVSNAKDQDIGSNIQVVSDPSTIDNYGLKSYIHGYSANSNVVSNNCSGYFKNEILPYSYKEFNYGVRGIANYANIRNYGVYGEAHDGVGENIGVYGTASSSSGTNWAGYFDGDVNINGFGYITHPWVITSDARLKINIETISNAMDIIEQLKPRSYFYKVKNSYGLRFGSEKQYGLLAQDVEKVLPEMVHELTKPATYDSTGKTLTDSITYKALNYDALFAIMLQGMQEQQHKIDSLSQKNSILDTRLANLESIVSNCCSDAGHRSDNRDNSSSINVDLGNAKSIILNQNVPNPFAEQTTITYFIPDDVIKAQIMFYDNKGDIMKIVEIKEKGKGQLNVYASDLSSGTYTYSLIADGKLIETKKMVCTK